ncbi:MULTISPECIES: hypothetical protein [Photorhabdus]|uniref:Uncharacterized protein n=1 Tax=Photorhabdus kayaii TaxID=230088 RepID=A0ABX0AST2_9GAMM|nr:MULTISPECIES: hypothetical protein [Photorhabdus]MCC8376209.1 hypothetical protein [Photorhabdus bodei]MCC8463589.1 hypothetical protein [Photorhabdus bodei]NDL10299.1 hypothetical protein [Photorhabdus kayaii]NDL23828.1 hypothetical protein [Photorhabdus kayaii]
MTGVSECSQQRGNLKDDGYRMIISVIYSDTKNTVTILKVAIKKQISTNQSRYLSWTKIINTLLLSNK